MHLRKDRLPGSGSALILSVLAVMVVSILAAGFLQLALSVTRRLNASTDSVQALNLAEAGLSEAYTGLAAARSGNLGSAAAPAVFGGGLVWVEATRHPGGLVELEATAMYGTGRAKLALVCEPVSVSVASLGFFTSESLRLNPDVRLDSYDSAQGTYADQLNTPLNNKATLGSNGDVAVASGNLVFGDVVSGPLGKIDVASGSVITGNRSARPEYETLPPIEVPAIALAKPLNQLSGVPLIVPPGEAGYQSIDVGKYSKLLLKGPLKLVVGSLTLRLGAEMIFDTSDGPVELHVTESMDMNNSAVVSTSTTIPADALVFVSAPAGKSVSFGAKSKFYGFIYAPEADVHVAAQFEIFGGLVCNSLSLAAQGQMHHDLSLGATLESALPLLHAWRVIELPREAAIRRTDPFTLLGLERTALPALAAAHHDQVLDVRYLDDGGATRSYKGAESDFDWSLVDKLLYGVRDGLAFYLPDDYALTAAIANDPLVDLVKSTLTSRQLRDELLAAGTVSEEALVAACERSPTMAKSDLKAVLDANRPLPLEALLAAITSAALDSSALRSVLVDNSPLDPSALSAVLTRSPPLSLSDLTAVLLSQ